MLRFSKSSIEAARTELEECGGYIEPMPLGVADDGCFYSIGGGFETVIADLYKAIEGSEFSE